MALFHGQRLVATSVVNGEKDRKWKKQDVMGRAVGMAHACFLWCVKHGAGAPDELVAEWPQIYSDTKSKGDRNPLIALGGVCTALAVYLGAPATTAYRPREWCGNLPKNETVKGAKKSPRASMTVGNLDQHEMAVWHAAKYHDEIDAMGIGLHHFGRFKRNRVFGT